jgi:predicted DNA-binding protein with PD1-like motif
MTEAWMSDARSPHDYHSVKARPGREYILRLTTGADVWLAVQRFAIDRRIRFARIHTAFMGGLQPARFLVWAPDTNDPGNWHHEEAVTIDNLSMILALGGIVHVREVDGEEEPFPAIHFVAGGAWNVTTIGGHLLEGSIVRGAFEMFITELEGIDVLCGPPDPHIFPENWYRELPGNAAA